MIGLGTKIGAGALLLLLIWGGVQWGEARHWRAVAVRAQQLLDDVKKAQAAADADARAEQKRQGVAQGDNNRKVTDDLDKAGNDRDARVAAMRLRIKALERAASARAVPGAGGDAGGVEGHGVDRGLSLADELALRERAQGLSDQLQAVLNWNDERERIERGRD